MKPLYERILGIALLGACALAAAEETPPAETVPLEASEDGTPLPLPVLDGTAALGFWVALSGERSKGEPVAFEWKQTAGPPFLLTEAEASAPRVWRLLERPGEYKFELKARNPKGWSPAHPLTFTVKDEPPVVPFDQALMFVGAGESLVDGIFLPGEGWKQVLGPETRLAYDAKEKATLFRLLLPGLYLFESTNPGGAAERRGFRVPPGVDEGMGDRRPEARVTLPQDAYLGQRVILDGSLSNDRDGETLSARWMSDELARGVSLKPLEGLKAEFMAEREGVYRVRLVVSDGKLASRPAETFLRVIKLAQPAPEEAPDVPPDTDPLSRRVTLRCYESNLDRAVQRFPTDCKVVLRVRQELSPPEKFETLPLDLGGEYIPVSLLLDWIARQTRSSYRRDGVNSVWLLRPDAWSADEELKNEVLAVDALYRSKAGAELMEILRTPFRGMLAERKDAQLLLQPETSKLIAILPLKACQRLREIIAFLRAPKGLGLPAPGLPSSAEFLLRRRLSETSVSFDWRGRRIDWALRDLAEAAGVPAGFDPVVFPPGKLPRLTLKLDRVPLREAVREIVEAAGFDGCQPQNGAGLWFYKGGEPYPSGELLWDLAYVHAYPLDQVLAKLPLLSGEMVAHQVRRKIFPASWDDPAACCRYHAQTGKLLVVHGDAAHQRIIGFLNDMLERGEDALGPVETAPAAK